VEILPEQNRLISTRMLLIGAIAFNVIAMCLAEMQRYGLSEKNRDTLIRLEKERSAEQSKRIDQLNKTISSLEKDTSELRWSMGALQILARSATDRRRVEAEIARQLNEGKTIILQFDDNVTEDRDEGRIRCGPSTDKGYLGVFIASEKYSISYDKNLHEWRGSGPSQSSAYNPKTGTCADRKAIYGPKELGSVVQPSSGAIILWGSAFQLDGLDVLISGRRVGSIGSID
jgi:hypothetical protein